MFRCPSKAGGRAKSVPEVLCTPFGKPGAVLLRAIEAHFWSGGSTWVAGLGEWPSLVPHTSCLPLGSLLCAHVRGSHQDVPPAGASGSGYLCQEKSQFQHLGDKPALRHRAGFLPRQAVLFGVCFVLTTAKRVCFRSG